MRELNFPFDGKDIIRRRLALRKQLLADGCVRVKKRIAVLGGSTTNHIVSALELFLLNFGICRANMTGHAQWLFCALYLVLTAVLTMNACYLFPMIARYDMPFGWYLRGSLFCVFR